MPSCHLGLPVSGFWPGGIAEPLIFQALGYAPCKLCLWQRYPHGLAIGVGALAYLWAVGWLPLAGAGAALVTACLGIYHAGIERGVFAGPDSCTSGPVGEMTAQELMDQILAAPLVRCDEVAWQLAGVSIAGWNAILSFGLAGIWVLAWRHS